MIMYDKLSSDYNDLLRLKKSRCDMTEPTDKIVMRLPFRPKYNVYETLYRHKMKHIQSLLVIPHTIIMCTT